MVRTMNNTCQYPSSCGTEVHSWGLIIGACYWHTRQLFAAQYGTAGKVMMDDYLYQHFHATPANQIESCLDMMLLNDNDANITNGTPDALLFYQGFTVQHSVPFPIPLMMINHNALRDTMDQLQNYQVHAAGTAIGYYLEFHDALGHVQQLPVGGASAPYSFLTFRRQVFFSDSFEAPSGWVSARA